MSQARRLRRALILAGLAGSASQGSGLSAQAASVSLLPPLSGVAQLFLPDQTSGLALHGFDPVSYFLADGVKPGRPEHEVVWSGLAWRFASAANREAFARDPDAYAPQFGGYDATALARGVIVQGNPLIAVVRADRLYLFRSDHGRARFLADESMAVQAENRWPELSRELVQP